MTTKQKGAQLLEQPDAHAGDVNSWQNDTSIVHKLWPLVKVFAALEGAALGGLLTAAWAIPAAWSERGWRGGFGGEWLLIFAVAWFGGWLFYQFTRES